MNVKSLKEFKLDTFRPFKNRSTPFKIYSKVGDASKGGYAFTGVDGRVDIETCGTAVAKVHFFFPYLFILLFQGQSFTNYFDL